MTIKEQGYVYELKNHESDSFQTLTFVKKERVSEGSTEMKTVLEGTTNEEVIAVVTDRLQYLNTLFPCRENSLAITKLEEALMWLNKRTENRKARGVEGQHIK